MSLASPRRIAAIAVAILAVFSGALWLFRDRMTSDQRALRSESADPGARFGALARLGGEHDPEARVAALGAAADPRELVRRGAAEALGNFEGDDATQALLKLSHDSATPVRLQAIEALGKLKVPARRARLSEISQMTGDTWRDERVAALGVRVRRAASPEERETTLKSLISVCLSAQPPESAQASLRTLIVAAPTDPLTLQALHAIVAKGNSTSGAAARHLTAIADSWFGTNLTKLLRSQNLSVRMVALQSFATFCPSERWQWLDEAVLHEREAPIRVAAIQVAAAMPSPSGLERLSDWGKRTELSDSERSLAASLASTMRRHPTPDPCQTADLDRKRKAPH